MTETVSYQRGVHFLEGFVFFPLLSSSELSSEEWVLDASSEDRELTCTFAASSNFFSIVTRARALPFQVVTLLR
jgi:hypothetical protein